MLKPSLLFEAFSSREPVSTSLENALLVLISGDGGGERRHVALRTLVENLLTFYHVKYGFRDIGGVIADPLDVLGAEHQMDAETDVARIFHHIGQQLAE
jgi:hypothetical protein